MQNELLAVRNLRNAVCNEQQLLGTSAWDADELDPIGLDTTRPRIANVELEHVELDGWGKVMSSVVRPSSIECCDQAM